MLPKLKIKELTIPTPIFQGGMGVGISLSGLASAVANEGGVGIISANAIGLSDTSYNKESNAKALCKEIKKARALTDGVLGVNIMVAVNDFYHLLNTAIDEKIDIITLGAGLPIKNIPIDKIKENNVKIIPIVSSARAASLIFKSWKKKYNTIPDAVIVEGPKAGGHLGFKLKEIDSPEYSLENIIPKVTETVSYFGEIPVIAAGGIYSGEDIYNFLSLGASGVQMGTRFVTTSECDANSKFKEVYLKCGKEDLTIIKSPVGMLGRAIKNEFLDDLHSELNCPWKCLASCNIKEAGYCIAIALDNARKGHLDKGFAFAGTNASKANKVISVKELINNIKKEYSDAKVNCTRLG